GDGPRLSWAPSKLFLRSHVRGRNVEREEAREPGKMIGCFLARFRDDRHLQASTDDVRDVSRRHALVRNPVKRGSCGTFLERQSEEMRGIEPVYSRPAVEPLADIRRNALRARDAD